jgi:ribosomal 50S subunit-recycling heat shock protein
MMRLDQFLKVSRIVPRRPLAKRLCDEGRIRINGRPAKAAGEIHSGDILEVDLADSFRRFRVEDVPDQKSVPKEHARLLAELLESHRKDPFS